MAATISSRGRSKTLDKIKRRDGILIKGSRIGNLKYLKKLLTVFARLRVQGTDILLRETPKKSPEVRTV